MKKITQILIVLMSILFIVISCKKEQKKEESNQEIAEVNYLNESEADFDARMEWWRNARFGMFIHWGVYAVPAGIHNGEKIDGIGEWIQHNAKIPVAEYEKYAKQFNPDKFDATAWAKTMKQAGMKYVVITSKHHDGFGLWDSEVSDYDVVDFAPYGKDILKALSDACKKEGIKFGLYHSIMDWHHPDAQFNSFLRDKEDKTDYSENFKKYLEEYMKPQLKELIDNYDPSILWFDGEWVSEFTHEQGKELYQYVRSLKPDIIINNRVDKGRDGMRGMNKADSDYAGDFGTPEQEILETTSDFDWESCMTMNDTWGFKSYDENWKSAKVLIHNLIDVTAKGGNYLLNVGPTAEGLIPEPSIERLSEIGRWLDRNGEAIYGTEKLKTNYKQGEDIRFTKKKDSNTYYGISLVSPKKEIVFTNLKPNDGSDIFMLGSDMPLKWTFTDGEGLKIDIPSKVLASINETNAWVFKITGNELDN
ncbi:alpha-L-fucosidase [Aureibaculum sp. 2210JD6-5]|uniref:alpha-L-fucosidase n=1 Tax=Aureibaculum sp. 2210JD6-5 TaxID=3103957 RepID=UPI002AAD6A1A|nr:alpha-L-fucosidase [Aureibaculum sp. 2210JD6-5]MDY7393984.1 alpha-L-fucosidase [Aureibaculum sp. 2210JD6-5]